MFLTYLTLAVALSLSAVAAFYSIAGLTVIFAAAAVPVIIMGTILEIAKLVVTVWLHEYWPRVKWTMKLYLVPAVVVLMFITSMGIFGFLSKAHIEQTAAGTEGLAQIERISNQIARQQSLIERADIKLQQLKTTGFGTDTNVQTQIDREQQRIDSAYERIQPAVNEQQQIINSRKEFYKSELEKIEQEIATLQGYIDNNEIRKAQAMVGAATDGQYGPRTAAAFRAWQDKKSQERQNIVDSIANIEQEPAVQSARAEIQRLRQSVETQVADSNRLINRLREQLGQSDTQEVENEINKQQEIINMANGQIDQLTEEKFTIESEIRKLEAEVGPIKYIAELVYDNTDKNMLEEAVRWVIVIIVAVFDPLAVMMLLAATESRGWHRMATGIQNRARGTVFESVVPAVDRPKSTVSTQKIEPSMTERKQQSRPSEQTDDTVAENSKQIDIPVLEGEELWEQEAIDTESDKSTVDSINQELDDDAEEHNDYDEEIKEAKRVWKLSNPDKTLKEQRRLFKQGQIDQLPWMVSDEPEVHELSFGQFWPDNPKKGYMFLRTDYVPTKLFKYNGFKWIEVNKDLTDGYAVNDAYIDFLIKRLKTGEYDPEYLSEAELAEIEDRMRKGEE